MDHLWQYLTEVLPSCIWYVVKVSLLKGANYESAGLKHQIGSNIYKYSILWYSTFERLKIHYNCCFKWISFKVFSGFLYVKYLYNFIHEDIVFLDISKYWKHTQNRMILSFCADVTDLCLIIMLRCTKYGVQFRCLLSLKSRLKGVTVIWGLCAIADIAKST